MNNFRVGDYVRLQQCAMYFYGVVIEINPWCASVELANGSIKYVPPSELAHCAMRHDQLHAFARRIMQAWPDGGIDGGELQDIALAHGLLRPAEPPTDWDGCNFYEKTELIK